MNQDCLTALNPAAGLAQCFEPKHHKTPHLFVKQDGTPFRFLCTAVCPVEECDWEEPVRSVFRETTSDRAAEVLDEHVKTHPNWDQLPGWETVEYGS